MNSTQKLLFSFSVLLTTAAAMAWQGGGGTGKVSVHDIAISRHSKILIACQDKQSGKVFVATGDIDGDGRASLEQATKNGRAGTVMLSLFKEAGLEPLVNMLKKAGGRPMSLNFVKISYLTVGSDSKVRESRTYKLENVLVSSYSGSSHQASEQPKPKPKPTPKPSGGSSHPSESLSLNFTKIEFSAAVQPEWKIAN